MVKTSELQPTFLVALSSFASSSSGSLPLLLLLCSLLISLLLNGAVPFNNLLFCHPPPCSHFLDSLNFESSLLRALSSTDLSSCAIPSAAPSSSASSTSPYISLLRLALRHPPPWRCHHHNQSIAICQASMLVGRSSGGMQTLAPSDRPRPNRGGGRMHKHSMTISIRVVSSCVLPHDVRRG